MTVFNEALRGFVRPWELHDFHREIAAKSGYENMLMQRGNTETLKESLANSFEGEEQARVQRAIDLAEMIHVTQMREDRTTPHLNHVLRVALRAVHNSQSEGQPVDLLTVFTAVLHDTEEDLQHLQGVSQKDFRKSFMTYFADEPLVEDIYANVNAFNKFRPDGTEKTDEEYNADITRRGLWQLKIADREDSLIGDIARAMTHKRGKGYLQRVRKATAKAQRTVDAVRAVDPSAVGRLPQVIEYASLFAGPGMIRRTVQKVTTRREPR
jgi:hypothetical protein